MTSQNSWYVLLCLREILSFIVACVRKLFPCFLFFFPYMVSLTYRVLGKLVIFLYFSRSGSFFPYPCLISASRRVKHFKKIPNSSNIEYFWRSQGGHLPPLGPPGSASELDNSFVPFEMKVQQTLLIFDISTQCG